MGVGVVLFLGLIVGLVLGLIGSGGGILAVPILVYVQGISPVIATAYSLFAVGVSSLTIGIIHVIKKEIDLKVSLVFMLPSMLSVFLSRSFLMPILPTNITIFNDTVVSRDTYLMLLFALFMMISSAIMLLKKKNSSTSSALSHTTKGAGDMIKIVFVALGEGMLSGLVGAGGGFIIVPVLTLMLNIPLKKAIATSLFIIAVKSIVGFSGEIIVNSNIQWSLLLLFTFVIVVGVFTGKCLRSMIATEKLKNIFVWFLITLSLCITIKELQVYY